jgi:hypothetical protein
MTFFNDVRLIMRYGGIILIGRSDDNVMLESR